MIKYNTICNINKNTPRITTKSIKFNHKSNP